jgi:uncharacterized protein (TIGR03086 family)
MTTGDLRPALAAAYDQAIEISTTVRPDQLGAPTPCTKMDVAALLDHLVFASRRAAALGRGEAPPFEQTAPHVDLTDVPDALRAASAEARSAWSDDASLVRVLTMPWGVEYAGSALVGIYLVELATHSWDLAVATGTRNLLGEPLGTDALACAEATIKPEYRSDAGEPFGPEVPPADGASAWDRLGAFMGRVAR